MGKWEERNSFPFYETMTSWTTISSSSCKIYSLKKKYRKAEVLINSTRKEISWIVIESFPGGFDILLEEGQKNPKDIIEFKNKLKKHIETQYFK